MTTEQTAQQFELAAKILRTGHPWEWQALDGEWVKPTIRTELHHVISDGLAIRLALAAPPDGRQLHNPDNLTAEQVGVGYRLMLPEEVDGRHEGKCQVWNGFRAWSSSEAEGTHKTYTYRLPISVPWPEPQPDPYAALKKAHAEGKVIQGCISGHWIDCPHPTWKYPVNTYREKPEVPGVCVVQQIIKNTPFQLPPPPPGMQWHRTDGWREGDLPQGMRPLVVGEEEHDEDEFCSKLDNDWMPTPDGGRVVRTSYKVRTRRPLTFTHAGKTWTWHRPGDPMPCDGTNRVIPLVCYEGKYSTGGNMEGSHWDWNDEYLIGWRYADEKKTVPLGPEDVMPCSVFRVKGRLCSGWHQMRECPQSDSVLFSSDVSVGYEELMRDWLINRSIPLTGKWNPDAWEPCHKEVDA